MYNQHPVFICSCDGGIILTNEAAEKALTENILGKNITEYMSPSDKLRYEFSLNSKKPRRFIAAAKLISGYDYLCVFPETYSNGNITAVIAAKDINKANELISLDDGSCSAKVLSDAASGLADAYIPDIYKENSLLAADKAVSLITQQLADGSKRAPAFHIDIAGNGDCPEAYICNMGISNFVSIFTAIVFIINDITSDGVAHVSLYPSNDSFEMKIRTNITDSLFLSGTAAFDTAFPICRIATEMCRYIAEGNDCSFHILCSEGSATFTVSFDTPDQRTDFKSSDPFLHLEAMLHKAFASFEAIYKEEGRE